MSGNNIFYDPSSAVFNCLAAGSMRRTKKRLHAKAADPGADGGVIWCEADLFAARP